jgi:hypothetical protein
MPGTLPVKRASCRSSPGKPLACGEAEHTARDGSDADGDANRKERISPQLDAGFGRAVFCRLTAGEGRATELADMLMDGGACWFRGVLDGFGCSVSEGCHGTPPFK